MNGGGLFGFFGNQGGQPANAAANPPAANSQQTQPPAAAQQGDTSSSATPSADTGAPSGTPAQSTQPAQTTNQDQPFNLAEALGLGAPVQTQPAPNEMTPEQMAQAAFSALLSGQQVENPQAAPVINFERLASELTNMDFTGGANLSELFGIDLDEAGTTNLRGALNSMQMQTVATMVPLMNALVSQAMQSAVQTSQTGMARDQTSQAIVQTFAQTAPYGSSPAIQPVVASLANLIAQQSPTGVDPQKASQAIQNLLSTLGQAVVPNPGQPQNGPQSGQDMSGVFN